MKKYFSFLVLVLVLISCHKDDGPNQNNPYLPNYAVNVQINMNLPAYNNLINAANAAYVSGQGIRGIIVFNTGSGYNAFDAACPNQALSSCSTMTISGINAVCPCDNKQYSLFTGQAAGMQYSMKQYRTSVNGNIITIYN
ncbi:hypothetical protein LZZ90_05165 [Flavobacterium sp. SM15]|uniref:Rieske (2Fe-2S) protein n=1 Tax=Flavobacterium sp. SM15 TaxID=2908005 RepID=UPI001EDB64AB|nr:hypothetical protein [Flavobacterium sp. SM15]MCG2610889.1 hypothetical protein [Flavobacterium sp. SM15]